jgi:hypothetical protein
MKPIKIPCGGCLDCRLKHSRENAIRCTHEASQHKHNSFITLTYSPEHLPHNSTFDFNHITLFIKKLRNHICIENKCKQHYINKKNKPTFGCTGKCPKIKTFGCAEYGEKGGRPHYHILIFGYEFPDAYYWRKSNNPRMKCNLYRSPSLEKIWPYGHSEIGSVTMQSAGYVARYVVKKNKTKREIEKELGRFHEKAICVSRKEGIGLTWLKKHYTDVYTEDLKTRKGTIAKMKPPKYYDRKIQELKLIDFEKIKLARLNFSMQAIENGTKQMTINADFILKMKFKQFERIYEKE